MYEIQVSKVQRTLFLLKRPRNERQERQRFEPFLVKVIQSHYHIPVAFKDISNHQIFLNYSKLKTKNV